MLIHVVPSRLRFEAATQHRACSQVKTPSVLLAAINISSMHVCCRVEGAHSSALVHLHCSVSVDIVRSCKSNADAQGLSCACQACPELQQIPATRSRRRSVPAQHLLRLGPFLRMTCHSLYGLCIAQSSFLPCMQARCGLCLWLLILAWHTRCIASSRPHVSWSTWAPSTWQTLLTHSAAP